MLIPSRKYTSTDANKLEALAGLSEKLMQKHAITVPELLAGLRYGTGRETWEEWLEQARIMCESYVNYHGGSPEKAEEMYGE